MISIISPIYNEEEIIESSYREIKSEISKITSDYEIIFANDGSTDNSKKILDSISAKDNKFKVISWQKNKGMGFAHRQLYKEAGGEIIIQTDIDLSIKPSIFKKMLDELEANDVVIASRYKGIKPDVPIMRKCISRIYYMIVRILFGIQIKDICSGFIAFNRNALENLDLKSDRFEMHAELLYKLMMNKCRIKEIPAKFIHRKEHSKFRPFRDSIKTFISTLTLWKNLRL